MCRPGFRAWVLVLALLFGLVPAARGAEPAPGPGALSRGPSPGSVALRSMVLPGWGEAANGKWLKSAAFFGAYGGLWAWAISIHQDKMDAIGRMNAASTDAERLQWRLEADRLESSRNGKLWLAGLTLLLSMADSYVDAHLRNFDRRMDATVGWIPDSGDPVLGVSVSVPVGAPSPAEAGR